MPVVWDEAMIADIVEVVPEESVRLATMGAAQLAAVRIGGAGRLAADVATPTFAGGVGLVGSNLIYAGVQDRGATIHAKNGRLLIGANKGKITGSADSVVIPAKHYLDVASAAFPPLCIAHASRLMP